MTESMREIDVVLLYDSMELIAREDVDREDAEVLELQTSNRSSFEIYGYDLVRLGRIFGLDVDRNRVVADLGGGALLAGDAHLGVYRGDLMPWTAMWVRGEIGGGGVLHLVLGYGDGETRELSYCGKFMVYWRSEQEVVG